MYVCVCACIYTSIAWGLVYLNPGAWICVAVGDSVVLDYDSEVY